jgi:type I restriction enzyme M protein
LPNYRGDYKQSDYSKVILRLTIIRRLDCVIGPTKDAVLEKYKTMQEPLTLFNQRILYRVVNALF